MTLEARTSSPAEVAAPPRNAVSAAEPHAAAREWPPLVRRLLRIPLFYKILIANAVIVTFGAIIGTLAAAEYLREAPRHSPAEMVLLLALAGVAVSVLVNALILRLALTPLQSLEEAAARVQDGDLSARAPSSPLADRELDRLIGTFNGMLDNLDAYRRRLRDVTARARDAEEEERKRIARELHDDTAQTLAALLIRLRLARGATNSAAQATFFEEIRGEISAALESVRRFARGLRPPALDELGLVPALESHVRGIAESVGLSVRVRSEPLDGLLSPQVELTLYRIVQEALSNVIRHSGATSAEVRLSHRGATVVATVEDNGRGFAVDRVFAAEGRGLGLYGMQERASYFGGRVEVRSVVGEGTQVQIEIPVQEQPTNG